MVEVMVFLKKYHFQSVEVVVWCEKLMTGFAGRGYGLVSFAKWEGLGRFVLVLLFQIKDLLGLHKIESFLSFKCLLICTTRIVLVWFVEIFEILSSLCFLF